MQTGSIGTLIVITTGDVTSTTVLSLAVHEPVAVAVIVKDPLTVGVNSPVEGLTPFPLQVTPGNELTKTKDGDVEHTGVTSVMVTVGV